MFNRPWFSRVWTIQEIGLAINAMVMCGDAEINFTEMATFAGWTCAQAGLIAMHFGIDGGRLFRPWACYTLPDKFEGAADNFISAIYIGWDRGALDARDYVYAFLGHCSV